MKNILIVLILLNAVLAFSRSNTGYSDLYLTNSTTSTKNILQYEGMSEFNSEIFGINYQRKSPILRIVDFSLDFSWSFNRNKMDGYKEYDYNQIYTEGVTTLIGYEFDEFYSSIQSIYVNPGISRFLTNNLYAGIEFPFYLISFNLQKVELEDKYSKAKLDYKFNFGIDGRTKNIHLYSEWNKFEEGMYLSFYYMKGLHYEDYGNKLEKDEMPSVWGFELSKSFLIDKYDTMIKMKVGYDTQTNKDYNYIFSNDEYPVYKWLTFDTFFSYDLSRKINLNMNLGLKSGEYQKYNDEYLHESVMTFINQTEINYYFSRRIRLYGQLGINKYLSDDQNPEDFNEFDSAKTRFKFGADVYIDIMNL